MALSIRQPITIFGTGGHAKVIADIVSGSNQFQVLKFVDLAPKGDFLGCPIVSFESWRPTNEERVVVAIGDNLKRQTVVKEILEKHPAVKFSTLVHPSAMIARDVTIGPGSVVMAGVCINSGTKIEEHCVVNTRASLDHDNHLESFVTIAPGAVTGGNVRVGRLSWLGLGTLVLEGRTIGANSLVGAGSLVNRDIPESVLGFGSPWKEIRKRKKDELFR